VNKTITLSVLLHEDATVAEATGGTLRDIGTVSAKGSAKRHPSDHPDDVIGFNLAVSRALRALADQYEQRAEYAQHGPAAINGSSITLHNNVLNDYGVR
jgi:hypothetical protein